MCDRRQCVAGLDKKPDFPDPATAQLDIVAAHRNTAMPSRAVHLPFERLDIEYGGKIEIFALDKVGKPEQSRPRRQIASDVTRLDHGGTFPVLAEIFIILRHRFHGDGRIGRARIGTQPADRR